MSAKYYWLITLVLLGQSPLAIAQTNLFAPFTFTNASGEIIANARPVKLLPNKIIYQTANGGGAVPLEALPAELRQRFSYDADQAAAADAAEHERNEKYEMAVQHQQQIKNQALQQQAKWETLVKEPLPPYRYSKRIVDGQTVNLMTLFLWSKTNLNSRTGRPLPAWVRVTGTKTTVMGKYWIIKARLEGTNGLTSRMIALQNPPLQDEADFLNVKNELTKLDRRAATLAQAAQKLLAQEDLNTIASTSIVVGKTPTDSPAQIRILKKSSQLDRGKSEIQNEQTEVAAQRAQITEYLRRFPVGDGYTVDLFAKETGRTVDELPIYDLGVLYP